MSPSFGVFGHIHHRDETSIQQPNTFVAEPCDFDELSWRPAELRRTALSKKNYTFQCADVFVSEIHSPNPRVLDAKNRKRRADLPDSDEHKRIPGCGSVSAPKASSMQGVKLNQTKDFSAIQNCSRDAKQERFWGQAIYREIFDLLRSSQMIAASHASIKSP